MSTDLEESKKYLKTVQKIKNLLEDASTENLIKKAFLDRLRDLSIVHKYSKRGNSGESRVFEDYIEVDGVFCFICTSSVNIFIKRLANIDSDLIGYEFK